MIKQVSVALLLALAGCHRAPMATIQPVVDYHLHLLGPYALPVEPSIADRYPPAPVTADKLIASMDKAGIQRGLVLSTGSYLGGGPRIRRKIEAKDNATAQQLENDWQAAQVARYPDRLVMACGVNPLTDYAIAELVRCKTIPQNRAVKTNVGEGGDNVNLNNPEHVAKLRAFFKAANDHKMPIVIHLGSAGTFGRKEVRIFLNEIVSAAPDIPIQIAHMSGAFQTPEALSEFADARAAGDPLAKNLYFDLSAGRFAELPSKTGEFLADAIRRIGLEHVLYASDELPGDHHPPTAQNWDEIRRNLPLTDDEFRAIADNITPYVAK